MIEVKTTGELKGYILFCKEEPGWEEKMQERAKKAGLILNYYYKQKVSEGVIIVSYTREKVEEDAVQE